MIRSSRLIIALCLCCMPAAAHAQDGLSRGKLLYATHCSACHTAEIHWRKQKLATDWSSLTAQVRRWQASTGLGWSQEEIADVARYLNATYYGFQEPGRKGYSQHGILKHVQRR